MSKVRINYRHRVSPGCKYEHDKQTKQRFGKVLYPTEIAARCQIVRDRILIARGERQWKAPTGCYYCEKCAGWHLTTRKMEWR